MNLFRTPSINKNISAKTSEHVKNELMRSVVPFYASTGKELLNPKKTSYNGLYKLSDISSLSSLLKVK